MAKTLSGKVALVAVATDARILEKSGGLFSSWNLAREYGFKDVDGSQPDLAAAGFEAYFKPKTQYRWVIQQAS